MVFYVEIIYVVVGLMMFLVYIRRKRKSIPKGRILDGPKGLPVLGNILQISDRNMMYKFMEYARQYGDMFRVKMFSNNVVVLNDHNIIRKAFGGEEYKMSFNDRDEMFYVEKIRKHSKFSVAFIRNGTSSHYKNARKALVKVVHAYGSGLRTIEKNVKLAIVMLEEAISDTTNNVFECVTFFQRSFSNVIALLLIGETLTDDESKAVFEFIDNSDVFLNLRNDMLVTNIPFLHLLPGWFRDKFQKANRSLDKLVQKYYYDCKKTYRPGEIRGIVDHYLDEQRQETDQGNYYPDDLIIAAILDIIHAGTTTTLSALSNTFLILLNNPIYQIKLQHEFDKVIGRERAPTFIDREKCTFFKAFEMEVMRYIPVSPLFLPHVCNDHVVLEGFDIPQGSTVLANAWFVYHNEKTWRDPWTFRPERFLDDHGNLLPAEHELRKNLLPFGYGVRHCPGEVFARSRYFLYISSLLQRWTFEFPEGEFRPCDPRLSENFAIKEIMRSLPFNCRAVNR